AIEAAVLALGGMPGVEAAYPVADLLAGKAAPGQLTELARASVTHGAGGDVFVVLKEHSVIDPSMPGASGTNHGSPWIYDRSVPVIVFGVGIAPKQDARVVDQLQVAPTIASLLGVRPPEAAAARALLELPEAEAPQRLAAR
ncbi:MAG TPA: hypothetical protein VGK73_32860, partial [Polyangiaceae bacterium]